MSTQHNCGPCVKLDRLDDLLCTRWDKAMSKGVFRYDLSGVVARRVPGDFGFIVQSNSKRHTHRRAPAAMASLQQDFDPTLFNFNKIKAGEVSSTDTVLRYFLFW